MLTELRWLGLEVDDVETTRSFYAKHLGMEVRSTSQEHLRLAAGRHDLVLRRPGAIPRGGVHTHYAMAVSRGEYDSRFESLSESFEREEHRFGEARSLYFDDSAGNCVELGERADTGKGIDHIFEVVLEVLDLDRSTAFYRDLGFEIVDRGDKRPRVRLAGPVELELWEPHLGLANARGGVHVDLGFAASDPVAAVDPVDDRIRERVELDSGVRVRDPDGHSLTVLPTA